MRRAWWTEEHEQFRSMVRRFLQAEVVPNFEEWRAAHRVPKEFFRQAAAAGITGISIPVEYGGGGEPSYSYRALLQEEVALAQVATGPLRCHMDIVLPYFLRFADEEQRRRWLPGIAAGELVTAIAMTEPGTGSDLAGISTVAERDGDVYRLKGSKTFITGGLVADLVVVVARTRRDPANRRDGLTLLVVEDGTPGFVRGGNLPKIGLEVQDTAELFFDDVQVPVANRLGEEHEAFSYLGQNLAQERLSIAAGSLAAAKAALAATVGYVRERRVFDRRVADFQNTKFELAAVATEVEAGEALIDRAIGALDAGELDPADAAKVKLFCTELQGRAVDRCLQMFGGYGYVTDYPIARLYADARVTRIYGGTSEVMKSIISKSIGL
ncbi:MAG TPA: acyl-CoA dehydrogenase family protein [Acidimicrobiales bacterium]|nr:acyl-CoA dehydrogenase family protein [Acidimicrobiales bacterium]